MLATLRHRLTYANVMSTLCFFILIGGTSYAAATLKKNSVLSKHIKNGQVQSADVKDRSLRSGDFAPGQLPAGVPGPVGPPGPRGETGAPGSALAYARVNADGTLDTTKSKNVNSSTRSINPVSSAPITGAYCLDLAVPVKNLSATLEADTGQVLGRLVEDPFWQQFCPGGGDARVVTQNSGGTAADSSFWVTFN